MNITKNQKYLIAGVAVLLVVYLLKPPPKGTVIEEPEINYSNNQGLLTEEEASEKYSDEFIDRFLTI